MTEPTEYQIQLMRHAMGITDRKSVSYRNYFAAAPNSKDYEEWQKLVETGYAHCNGGNPQIFGSLIYFSVDPDREHLLRNFPLDPKISRAKKRYRAYLEADVGESFYEWLRNKGWNDFRRERGC